MSRVECFPRKSDAAMRNGTSPSAYLRPSVDPLNTKHWPHKMTLGHVCVKLNSVGAHDEFQIHLDCEVNHIISRTRWHLGNNEVYLHGNVNFTSKISNFFPSGFIRVSFELCLCRWPNFTPLKAGSGLLHYVEFRRQSCITNRHVLLILIEFLVTRRIIVDLT